jgi:hypothetical protein
VVSFNIMYNMCLYIVASKLHQNHNLTFVENIFNICLTFDNGKFTFLKFHCIKSCNLKSLPISSSWIFLNEFNEIPSFVK